jgi:phytanoyl-CoA hydroxylase
MTLNDAQVKQFKSLGYTTEPRFFTRHEIEGIRAELNGMRRAGKFNNVACEGDGKTPSKTVANLQICPLVDKSELFRALPFHPKVLSAVSQLVGDPVVLHLDQVFLKPARHGSGTNWHQDNSYFKIADPMAGTAMWIAIDDATVANGTIEVIPGMAYEVLPHERDGQSNHHIRCWPDESKAVPIELPAGGVVFFAYGIPHCTRANNTDRDRSGLAYHFLNKSQISVQNPHGTMLTGPDATGGLKEYGVNVSKAWPDLIDRALRQEEALAAV